MNLKLWTILFAGSLLVMTGTAAAQDPERGKGIEIPAEQERLQEETLAPKKIEKIEEIKEEIPEVPKSMKDRELTPAEKERMAQLEQQRASGDLTDPEYNLETDALHREANIKF